MENNVANASFTAIDNSNSINAHLIKNDFFNTEVIEGGHNNSFNATLAGVSAFNT
jgi:hypothetical protein